VVGAFQRDREVDAAVAALLVTCPYVDRTTGTSCRWTGTLEHFDKHAHVFDDERQVKEEPAAEETRGTKHARSEDDREVDQDEEVNLDEEQIPPPPKVIRIGDVQLNYMRMDNQGTLRFSTHRPVSYTGVYTEEEGEVIIEARATVSAVVEAVAEAIAAALAAEEEEQEQEQEQEEEQEQEQEEQEQVQEQDG